MHEILTIQCGNTANYIGTHFWNFQDPTSDNQGDVDHDVLFSAGQARNGTPTYTPRLLIYDSARNFGSMARINALFEEPETDTSDVQLITSERVPTHPFQESLEESPSPDGKLLDKDNVRYWSDFNMQFHRPQSYLPLDSFADTTQLNDFDAGRQAWTTRNQRIDVLDSDVRPFLEECDSLQGFNITSSLIDGWGGYTTDLILELSAEFPKIPLLLFSSSTPTTRAQNLSLGNVLLAIHEEVDAIIPFHALDSWTSTANAANWIDTFTLPFRTKENKLSVGDVLSVLTPGHKVFSPRLSGQPLGPITNVPIDRRFTVKRSQTGTDLQSELIDGGLVTIYRHESQTEYPASFPASLKLDKVVATIEDSSLGSTKYLAKVREMIGGIRGAKGYNDRKDLLGELVELEGNYKSELMESEASSDEDGF